jgi:hypothetical protein
MKNLYLLFLLVLSISIAQAQRAPVAINDVVTIYENGSVYINVLANDSNFNLPDSVCVTAIWGGYSGWPAIQSCTQIRFHPLNPTFVGMDTFYYQSCDQVLTSLCDTGRVIVTVLIEAPKALNDTTTLLEGDSVTMNVLANDTNYNPQDSIRITNIWGETGWVTILDSTQIKVHPTNPYYYGVYTFSYRACDTHVPGLCDTGSVVVNIIRTPIAYPDTASLIQPDTAYIFVIANDSDFNAFDSACVTNIWPVPAGWGSIQGCGQINFDPANLNFAGNDTFYYQSCYTQTPTVCDTGMVVVMVTLPVPQIDFEWTEDSPCVAVVYNNSILADSIIWTVQYLTDNGQNDTLYNVNQFQIESSTVDSGFNVQVCLTAFNPTGDSTVCYTFWIQCTFGNDGIVALASSHLLVYPDPATDRIQIDISKVGPGIMTDVSSVVIYDMLGQVLKTISVSELGNPISVSDLSAGMYLIGFADKEQSPKMLSKFEVMR